MLHRSAHPGIRSTVKLVSCSFVWPKMAPYTRNLVRTCLPCQRASPRTPACRVYSGCYQAFCARARGHCRPLASVIWIQLYFYYIFTPWSIPWCWQIAVAVIFGGLPGRACRAPASPERASHHPWSQLSFRGATVVPVCAGLPQPGAAARSPWKTTQNGLLCTVLC
jgi:hypothetical protein